MIQFFDAIKAGDSAKVTELLAANPSLVNTPDASGLAPFTVAKYNRKEDIAQLLERHGAQLDIFAAAMVGRTARILELLSGNKSLVKLMSHDGWTPLHLAAFFGHKEAAEALLNAGAEINARSTNAMQNTPLHAATAGKKADVILVLVERGADVNARQHGGWTPLHAAAQNGDLPTVELLLQNGADAKARAENNQSALDLALTKGHQSVVDLLDRD